jgi:hypothetical protein
MECFAISRKADGYQAVSGKLGFKKKRARLAGFGVTIAGRSLASLGDGPHDVGFAAPDGSKPRRAFGEACRRREATTEEFRWMPGAFSARAVTTLVRCLAGERWPGSCVRLCLPIEDSIYRLHCGEGHKITGQVLQSHIGLVFAVFTLIFPGRSRRPQPKRFFTEVCPSFPGTSGGRRFLSRICISASVRKGHDPEAAPQATIMVRLD